jgi:hypothetical protein
MGLKLVAEGKAKLDPGWNRKRARIVSGSLSARDLYAAGAR